MNITPANEIMLFSKKEYSALYLMEVSYQSKSPFIIFGETVFGNNSVIKTFLRKHSNNNKIYTLVENSPISDVNDLKNKEVIIYLEDVNLDSTNIKVTSILDYYCKENRSIIKGKEVKMSNALINKKLKDMWNSLSDTDKSKYKI